MIMIVMIMINTMTTTTTTSIVNDVLLTEQPSCISQPLHITAYGSLIVKVTEHADLVDFI